MPQKVKTVCDVITGRPSLKKRVAFIILPGHIVRVYQGEEAVGERNGVGREGCQLAVVGLVWKDPQMGCQLVTPDRTFGEEVRFDVILKSNKFPTMHGKEEVLEVSPNIGHTVFHSYFTAKCLSDCHLQAGKGAAKLNFFP